MIQQNDSTINKTPSMERVDSVTGSLDTTNRSVSNQASFNKPISDRDTTVKQPVDNFVMAADTILGDSVPVYSSFIEEGIFSDTSSIRMVSIGDMFGDQASLVVGREHNKYLSCRDDILVSNYVSLSLVVLYVLMIYRFSNLFHLFYKAFIYRGYDVNIKESSDLNIVYMFRFSGVIYSVGLSLFVYNLFRISIDDSFLSLFGYKILLISIVVVLLILLYRFIMMRLIAYFEDNNMAHFLSYVGHVNTGVMSMFFTPVIIVTTLATSHMFYIAFIIATLLITIDIIKRYTEIIKFFIAQKVSFLQYILYFCIVEIVPVSFVVVYSFRDLYLK